MLSELYLLFLDASREDTMNADEQEEIIEDGQYGRFF